MAAARYLGLLTPEVEALADTNFYEFVGAVWQICQEQVYAPITGKILLGKFKGVFNTFDAMIKAKVVSTRTLSRRVQEIAGGREYRELLNYMDNLKWRVESNLDCYSEIDKCVGLRAYLIRFKPKEFDTLHTKEFYELTQGHLKNLILTFHKLQDTHFNVSKEFDRQLQEFELYKQKFKDAQQAIMALSKKPAPAVPASPSAPAASATPVVAPFPTPPSAPPLHHEEKSTLPAGSRSMSREASRDSDSDDSCEDELEHGIDFLHGRRGGPERGGKAYGLYPTVVTLVTQQREEFLRRLQQQPSVAVAASGANSVGKVSKLSFVTEAKNSVAAVASYASPGAGRVSALSMLAPAASASQAAAAVNKAAAAAAKKIKLD